MLTKELSWVAPSEGTLNSRGLSRHVLEFAEFETDARRIG